MRQLSWTVFGLALFGLAACGDGGDAEAPVTEAPETGGEAPAEPGESTESPEPAEPTEPGAGRTSPDGMCGGIAGFTCPEGEWCDMDADHPDASGTCRPEGTCDEPADCEAQNLVHAMCVGQWTCADGRCGWACD